MQIESLETSALDVLGFIFSLRNTLRPVNRLPPEILSLIAQDVRDFDDDARTIIPLTHVCRYWRESIVSIPENWAIISNDRRSLAATSLERAKAAPLEVSLDMGGIRDHPRFFDLLIPHIPNIETLWLNRVLTTEELVLFSQHPMPNLRSLTLRNEEPGTWGPPDPFETSALTLRYLSLEAVPLFPSLLNLTTLTELHLIYPQANLHLDTILDFLEANRSLTILMLQVEFMGPSFRSSRRRTAIENQLRSLHIICYDAKDGQALLSNIALSKGADLILRCWGDGGVGARMVDILPGISATHLSNLSSPTFMMYCVHLRCIRLVGPDGEASFFSGSDSGIPFVELPRLPLAHVRKFRLDPCGWEPAQPSPDPVVFRHLPSFPALETFIIGLDKNLPFLLSPLLSNPAAVPSLKTLAFFDCILTEDFMGELTRFASDRRNTASAWLHRVVIIHWDGMFPSITSIRKLEEHVPVVDVRIASELPTDL